MTEIKYFLLQPGREDQARPGTDWPSSVAKAAAIHALPSHSPRALGTFERLRQDDLEARTPLLWLAPCPAARLRFGGAGASVDNRYRTKKTAGVRGITDHGSRSTDPLSSLAVWCWRTGRKLAARGS